MTSRSDQRLVPLLTPRLSERAAADRALVARFLTLHAMESKDVAAWSALLTHRDAAVRKAAVRLVSTRDPVRAGQYLVLAKRAEPTIRHIVADAVADGMEPGFATSEEVLAARANLFASDPEVRLAAIHAFPRWTSDMVDLRAAAPHLGFALFDADRRVREAATTAVYRLVDMQAPVFVVGALRWLLPSAMKEWEGEPAANLRSALRSLSR